MPNTLNMFSYFCLAFQKTWVYLRYLCLETLIIFPQWTWLKSLCKHLSVCTHDYKVIRFIWYNIIIICLQFFIVIYWCAALLRLFYHRFFFMPSDKMYFYLLNMYGFLSFVAAILYNELSYNKYNNYPLTIVEIIYK